MNMSTRTLPDSIALAPPDNWSDFPLDADDFRAFRTSLIETLGKDGEITRGDQRQIEIFLTTLHRYAAEQKVIMAAGAIDLVEMNEGDGADTDDGLGRGRHRAA